LTQQIPGPLPEEAILTSEDAQALQVLTLQINGLISVLAGQFNFPVADIFSVVNDLDANGIEIGDLTLTTDFLGGLYSLDGIHPTNTGHAVIGNEFIRAINEHFQLLREIEAINLEAVAASDPLVFGPMPGPLSLGITELVEGLDLSGMTAILRWNSPADFEFGDPNGEESQERTGRKSIWPGRVVPGAIGSANPGWTVRDRTKR
jgi:hypothetical protein